MFLPVCSTSILETLWEKEKLLITAIPLFPTMFSNILCIRNANVLQWPARSPHHSFIEHLWDQLSRQVRERHDVNNICDLERALKAVWVRIPLQVIRKLIYSIRCCCLAVLAANGGHTRY